MRLDKMFIGIVVVLFILTAGILIISEQAEEYDYEVDTTSEKTFPNTARYVLQIENATSNMREPLEREDGFTLEVMFGFLLGAGYEVLQLVWGLLSIPFGLAADFYALLEIPEEFAIFFTIGLTILVIFSLVYLFFRFQPR